MKKNLMKMTIKEKGIFFMTLRNDLYWHESKNAFHCSLYDSVSPMHKVKVEEDFTGKNEYYGWFDNSTQDYRMIWCKKQLVEICFPYGYKIEEEKGKGRLVPLKISFIEVVNK